MTITANTTPAFRREMLRCLIISKAIANNCRVFIRQAFGQVDECNGSHPGWPVSRSVDYIERVFEDYLIYSRLTVQNLLGRDMLELGPGDNLGVALRFIAAGAKSVVALDKFYSKRDRKAEREIYLALRGRLSSDEKSRFDSAVNLDGGMAFDADKLSYVYGRSVDSSTHAFPPASFDLIVSRAVLMEVKDLDRAFENMQAWLRPGGTSIHKIAPLHDYKLFSDHGFHPLEFLTVPALVYRLMSSHCGAPNRVLVNYYRDKIRDLQFDGAVHITNTLANGAGGSEFPPGVEFLQERIHYSSETLASIREARRRLLLKFQALSDEDLLTEGFFLVMTKPCEHR